VYVVLLCPQVGSHQYDMHFLIMPL